MEPERTKSDVGSISQVTTLDLWALILTPIHQFDFLLKYPINNCLALVPSQNLSPLLFHLQQRYPNFVVATTLFGFHFLSENSQTNEVLSYEHDKSLFVFGHQSRPLIYWKWESNVYNNFQVSGFMISLIE